MANAILHSHCLFPAVHASCAVYDMLRVVKLQGRLIDGKCIIAAGHWQGADFSFEHQFVVLPLSAFLTWLLLPQRLASERGQAAVLRLQQALRRTSRQLHVSVPQLQQSRPS